MGYVDGGGKCVSVDHVVSEGVSVNLLSLKAGMSLFINRDGGVKLTRLRKAVIGWVMQSLSDERRATWRACIGWVAWREFTKKSGLGDRALIRGPDERPVMLRPSFHFFGDFLDFHHLDLFQHFWYFRPEFCHLEPNCRFKDYFHHRAKQNS